MQRLNELFSRWRIIAADLVSSGQHTEDFNSSRGQILHVRGQVVAVITAVLALLWIPVDFLMLPPESFQMVLWMRMVWSLLFLLIAFGWPSQDHSLRRGYLRLLSMVLIYALAYFYLWLFVFENTQQQDFTAGYSFVPYIAIMMLAVFPLTLVEGMIAITLVALAVLGTDLQTSTILALPIWIKLWFIGVIAIIVMWASASQLHGLMALYREATRDTVTGLFNRRLILGELRRLRSKLLRQGRPGAVMLADLDRFKRINDEFGHLSGDRVLQDFAKTVSNLYPSRLQTGRYGGEEFLILASGVTAEEACKISEEINQALRDRGVAGVDGELIQYTASIGVAAFVEGESDESLLNRADQALYLAKGGGRDSTVLAAPEAH